MNIDREQIMAQIIEHQEKALLLIENGEGLLSPGAAPDQAQLSRRRWEFVRLVGAYQAFKDHELLNPLIRGGTPEEARMAQQIKDDWAVVADAFRAHCARCANLDIAAEWATYRPAVALLTANMKAHLPRERRAIEAMLQIPASGRPPVGEQARRYANG